MIAKFHFPAVRDGYQGETGKQFTTFAERIRIMGLKSVVLKKGKEASPLRFHRWIFSGAIQQADPGLKEGDLVEVKSKDGKFLGTGFFNNGSIAVKILDFIPVTIDQAWFEKRFRDALVLREKAGLWKNPLTNCFRLVHAEGDGIPGLIIDYYDGHLVLQIHSQGIYQFKKEITAALKVVLPELKTAFLKLPEKASGIDPSAENEWLSGDAKSAIVKENGIEFEANWERGQKTGFFLDQRENRKLLGQYSKGKKVLNTFCYTGGFSLYALQSGAVSVDSVDYSQWAVDQVTQNILNNNFQGSHSEICGDALKYLSEMGGEYEVVVLDPPAFAKSVSAKHNAIQAYKRINALTMKKIQPGGILFTFSCSQVIDKFTFTQTVLSAAIEARREVKILHSLSQPADHPISIFHPESEYLKGLVVYVQ